MSAIALMVVGLGAFTVGYLFYSRFISERVFQLDEGFRTPAHEQEDGVDFVPTNKWVLWGHHFTSVAGAAPIVGPAIAVIWGWLPAFLWVTLGTVFFAGIHDAGALWASVRNRGQSIGALTEAVVGKRARGLFMIVIFLLLLMVNAVFAIIIARLFVDFPTSVIPAWFVIGVAICIGYLLYRKGVPLLWPSIIGVTLLYGSMFVGIEIPLSLPETVMGLPAPAMWVLLLFGYAAAASLLPVWLLLQPRDYINGLQLFIGLGIFYLGVLFANPTVVAPPLNQALPADAPPLVPLLFVTIACGAVSGFHGLVSSGTTSKQINNEQDVRFVGFLGTVGEGALALASIICCTAGFAAAADWQASYAQFAGFDGLGAFVQGGGAILADGLRLPVQFGQTLLAVMAILFAATTMDTGVRLQRYIVQEMGSIYGVGALTRRDLATVVAVGCCLLLAFGAGGGGAGGLVIWPLFGTTNQLLAALTLLVLSVFLMKLGRPTLYTLIPFAFLLTMTIFALIIQLRGFWSQGNRFLAGLDVVILVTTIWVALEAFGALQRARSEPREQAA